MALFNHEKLPQAFREALLRSSGEILLHSPFLTAIKLERRAESRQADDQIVIKQPLRNLLRPEDDAFLRDLGIEPPACNYSPALEAWRLQRFAISGTFEIEERGHV